jgi:catechol 2,3-dioxygenase-like lactoylglutathione lyase family enzyme
MRSRRTHALVLGTVVVAGLAASRQSRGSLDAGALLGTGHGLDHVIVIVRDLEEASRTYSETLGFALGTSGRLPGGIRNQLVAFGPTYLELMSIDAAQADQQNEIVRLLKEREGGYAFALDVSSAQRTAAVLRARNIDVVGPVDTGLWQTVAITRPVLPFQPMFFIEYAAREGATPRPGHRNTAVRLHSVWIAVKDLGVAVRAYEGVGLRAGRQVRMPQLSASGREIDAGAGRILLVAPNDSTGSLSRYVAQYGEGVVGASIEVRDMQAARSLLQESTKQALPPFSGIHGRSILVPPAFCHGMWLELFRP